jgi:hypothetical protein
MLGVLIKKKLSDQKIANIFVNAILDVTEKGFEEVAGLINEDPAFTKSPQIHPLSNNKFTLIIIAGNIQLLDKYFDIDQVDNVKELIFEKFSQVFGIKNAEMRKLITDCDFFMSRINHPSKNTLYAMSKAVFHKYNLNEFQDDYFKKTHCPNPLFLKRMDDVLINFIWDWDAFFKKYKLSA